MSKYIDGFVIPIRKDKTDAYTKMALGGRDVWMKHGALAYYECRGDALEVLEMGGQKTRSFIDLAGAKEGETVWFSFIVFKSKAHRDEVNAKVMAEMEEQMKNEPSMEMPFETERMAYGGFQAEVEGEANPSTSK